MEEYTDFEKVLLTTSDGEDAVEVIRKYEFEPILMKGFKELDNCFGSDLSNLPRIVGLVLDSINVKLQPIKKRDKLFLEDIIGELFHEFITTLKKTKDGFFWYLESLKTLSGTCLYRGYDFKELTRILGVEEDDIQMMKQNEPIKIHNDSYYEWCGLNNKSDLYNLSNDLQSMGIINGVVKFRQLFKPINSAFTFKVNKDKIYHLIILFHILYNEEKLIAVKKGKGHFEPLYNYAVCDNGERLFNKKPNKVHESIKRKTVEYNRIIRVLRKTVASNCKN